MNGAKHIGGVGFDRLLVRLADEWLRREMKYEIRLRRLDRLTHGGQIANVTHPVMQALREGELIEQGRFRRRRQRESGDISAQAQQPFRQPRPLKPVWPVTRTRLP